jgi:hypothetical protein
VKKNAAIMTPGVMPPMSRSEIEILARLPSKTDSADGGMSMAMPPVAIIGPMAITGS